MNGKNPPPPTPQPLYKSAAFVNGQISALEAMFIAVIRTHHDADRLRDQIAHQLEMLRTASLPQPMPDDYLSGIDQTEALLRRT